MSETLFEEIGECAWTDLDCDLSDWQRHVAIVYGSRPPFLPGRPIPREWPRL